MDVSAIKSFLGKRNCILGKAKDVDYFLLTWSSLVCLHQANPPPPLHWGSEWAILAAQVPLAFGFENLKSQPLILDVNQDPKFSRESIMREKSPFLCSRSPRSPRCCRSAGSPRRSQPMSSGLLTHMHQNLPATMLQTSLSAWRQVAGARPCCFSLYQFKNGFFFFSLIK